MAKGRRHYASKFPGGTRVRATVDFDALPDGVIIEVFEFAEEDFLYYRNWALTVLGDAAKAQGIPICHELIAPDGERMRLAVGPDGRPEQ